MLKEALTYLVGIGEKNAAVNQFTISDRLYTDKSLLPLKDPTVDSIDVTTLSGLRDLLQDSFEGFDAAAHLIHVVSHSHVQVVTKKSNKWKDREVLVDCNLVETKGFPFDQFLNHENFVIGVLTSFADSGDKELVLKVASNVTGEAVVVSSDDGVSQQLAVKRGVTLKESVTVRTVKLAPFRTFREVEQPLCEFALRAKQPTPDSIPQLSLWDADGGKWKLVAVENIARKLRAELPGVTVVS